MNYQNKDNLTFNKRRFNPYGAGEEYVGGTLPIIGQNSILLVEGGSILTITNLSLLKVNQDI